MLRYYQGSFTHIFDEIEPNEHGNRAIQSMSNKYWEKHKPILERLYMVDNKPLTEVQSFMEEQHNFKAT